MPSSSKQAIDDHVTNAVGVLGSGLDAIDLGTRGLATGAVGAVISDRQFDDGDFAESDVANSFSSAPVPGDFRIGVLARE
jgi:hypothetical protein